MKFKITKKGVLTAFIAATIGFTCFDIANDFEWGTSGDIEELYAGTHPLDPTPTPIVIPTPEPTIKPFGIGEHTIFYDIPIENPYSYKPTTTGLVDVDAPSFIGYNQTGMTSINRNGTTVRIRISYTNNVPVEVIGIWDSDDKRYIYNTPGTPLEMPILEDMEENIPTK